ncbi:hypothetical protein KI387_044764, partial [Taxus chinensis]
QHVPPPLPDLVLDEWVERHQKFDPYAKEIEAFKIGLGTYCILEEEVVLPPRLKKNKENSGLWKLYFDGSRSINDVGA